MSSGFEQQLRSDSTSEVRADRLGQTGERLPDAVRDELSAGFGADFSEVRVASTAAAEQVTAHEADAMTMGDDIAFGRGAYQPGSSWGRGLIAHELAHVVQQRGGTGGPPLADPASYEQQADAAAHAAITGRAVPALSPAPVGAQPRISLRDVGRGEQSGFARVAEVVDRLNRLSLGLVFTTNHEGRFDWLAYTRILPLEICSGFDKQMMEFIDAGADLLMRFTNRHGLLGTKAGGFNEFVNIDAWQSGYVDIDDLLASSDAGFEAAIVHFLRERQLTPNYEHRIGIDTGPGALDVTPGHDAEFQHAHEGGIRAELRALKDYFGDDKITVIDLQNRRFLSSRGDVIRVKVTEGTTHATSGIFAVSWEVVLHDTHKVISDVEYRDLLERERAAAPAVP